MQKSRIKKYLPKYKIGDVIAIKDHGDFMMCEVIGAYMMYGTLRWKYILEWRKEKQIEVKSSEILLKF